MKTQKIVIGGIAGGIAYFLLGWIIYGILLSNFFKTHMGSHDIALLVPRSKDEMMHQTLYIVIGNFSWGFLLSIIFGKWANTTTAMAGFIHGAIIGFLVQLGHTAIDYGATNIMTRKYVLVDIIAFTILSALAGAVIGWVLGMNKKPAEN